MTIVLPILFFAVGVGLFVDKVTPRVWLVVAAWIVLVIGLNYIKPATVGELPGKAATSAATGAGAQGS